MTEANMIDALERQDAMANADFIAASFNLMSGAVNRLNRHFYRDIHTGAPIERNKAELIALMHSELSEMLEGLRKNTMDSHLPHRRSDEVELADLLIRAFDYAGYCNMDIAGAVREKLAYNASRKDHTDAKRRKAHGKKF